MVGCTFDGVNNSAGHNGGYIDLYRHDNILYERNFAKNCTTNYGFWLKSSRSFISVRANVAVENVNGSQITIGMGGPLTTGGTPHDMELCWNAIAVPQAQSGDAMIVVNDSDHQGAYYNIFVHRNSVFGGTTTVPGFAGLEPIETNANIIVTNDLSRWNTANQETAVANYVTLPAGAVINNQCELLGAAGFGTHGWEYY